MGGSTLIRWGALGRIGAGAVLCAALLLGAQALIEPQAPPPLPGDIGMAPGAEPAEPVPKPTAPTVARLPARIDRADGDREASRAGDRQPRAESQRPIRPASPAPDRAVAVASHAPPPPPPAAPPPPAPAPAPPPAPAPAPPPAPASTPPAPAELGPTSGSQGPSEFGFEH